MARLSAFSKPSPLAHLSSALLSNPKATPPLPPPIFNRWSEKLPFTYESNGEEYRFRNLRDPRSRSRFVFGVHRSETLLCLVEQKDTLRARLQKFPSLPTGGLRDCQFDFFISTDRNLRYQQRVAGRKIAILILSTNDWHTIRAKTKEIADRFADVKAGDYLELVLGR